MTRSKRARPPLPVCFFARDPVRVARDLLGCIVESSLGGARTAGRIVEVEAYTGVNDPAAHSFGARRTARTEVMFGRPGRVYVYFSYGMHWCMNAVTQPLGTPSAVLIRALQPLEGIEVMRERRGVARDRLLCSGPARLCQALGVTGEMNGEPLFRPPLQVRKGPPGRLNIQAGPRIGISQATDWPLRFIERGSPWISRPMP